MSSIQANLFPNLSFNHIQTSTNLLGIGNLQCRVNLRKSRRKLLSYSCIRCEKKDEINKDEEKKERKYQVIDYVTNERPSDYSYMDSTSRQLEPTSGARASIPEVEFWPEGIVEQVRAANAPTPNGESLGSPSYGSNHGSRKKGFKMVISGSSVEGEVEGDVERKVELNDTDVASGDLVGQAQEDLEEFSSDYVVYQSEPEEEDPGYKLDKKFGAPHLFIDPENRKTIEGTLTSEELWWNWRKPEKEQSFRWQKRRPDSETVSIVH